MDRYLADEAEHWEMCYNDLYQVTCFYSYSLLHQHKHPLDITDQHDYLGVRLHSSMTWSHHIHLKVNKATKLLNFIKRTFYKCTKEVKETAYFTLVRPVLEYAAIIWDPYQQYLVDNIEKIQRRTAGWVIGDYCFFK